MTDEIIGILSKKDIKSRFKSICYELFSQYEKHLDSLEENSDSLNEWWSILSQSDIQLKIEELAGEIIINELPTPPRITLLEMEDAFFSDSMLEEIPPDLYERDKYFEDVYKGFLSGINDWISTDYKSEPIPFCTPPLSESNPKEVTIPCVWEKDGITVSIVTNIEENDKEKVGKFNYCATISGRMSRFAAELLEKEIPSVLSCAVRSSLLMKRGSDVLGDSLGGPNVFYYILRANHESLLKSKRRIKEYLNAYSVKTIKKKKKGKFKEQDIFQNRVKNAIYLLAASDGQTNNATGLALSVSAIESLLCEGSGSITEQLSTKVATLLEPKLNHRLEAERFVRKIYNARSRVLHGESIEASENLRIYARHLAAAVLDAIFLYIDAIISDADFWKRVGNVPKERTNLLSDLKKWKYKEGNLDEILDYENVRKHWRK